MEQLIHHFGPCPVCNSGTSAEDDDCGAGGLCRPRICGDGNLSMAIVLCDECDAYWLSPETHLVPQFLDAETGEIGDTGITAWGKQGHWASTEELTQLGWNWALVSVEPPTVVDDVPDPQAVNADVLTETTSPEGTPAATDSSYGQDDPKPGC